MTSDRARLVQILEQTYSTLVQLTTSLNDAALDFRTSLGNAALDFRASPDEWSIREVLAHLVDDEMYVMRTRLERIVKEDHPHLTPHDEKKWYAARNTTRDALVDLLADFQLQRSASLGIMKMLRESDWAREGYQPEYGHFTAEEWLKRWVDHDATHIQQIENNLALYRKLT